MGTKTRLPECHIPGHLVPLRRDIPVPSCRPSVFTLKQWAFPCHGFPLVWTSVDNWGQLLSLRDEER